MRRTLASLALAILSVAACKSGEGERCQVNEDCEDGLVCVPLSSDMENPVSVCRAEFESQLDAGIDAPQDGPENDGAPGDATPDAAVDAMDDDAAVDAMPDA